MKLPYIIISIVLFAILIYNIFWGHLFNRPTDLVLFSCVALLLIPVGIRDELTKAESTRETFTQMFPYKNYQVHWAEPVLGIFLATNLLDIDSTQDVMIGIGGVVLLIFVLIRIIMHKHKPLHYLGIEPNRIAFRISKEKSIEKRHIKAHDINQSELRIVDVWLKNHRIAFNKFQQPEVVKNHISQWIET